MNGVAKNIADVRGRIKAAAEGAGRADEMIELIAVSKTQTDEAIEAALAAGQRVFGENRVQEAQVHWGWADGGRRERFADLRLHLIGPLQTNKVRDAVRLFDVIETVDRADLARKLARDKGLRYLSMGMSGDYEAAIAEGATHVRVGTALFGARAG